jgi:hypothetical protein
MIRQAVLFDNFENGGLWETNGTTAASYELTGISGALDSGIFLAQ